MQWVFFILPSLFSFSREFFCFAVGFLYSAVSFLYFAVFFFILLWVFFILPWLCLCCRDFNYTAVVLFFLPWQWWATVSYVTICEISSNMILIFVFATNHLVKTWRHATIMERRKGYKLFRLVFCQNLCKITHKVCFFCCQFLTNDEEILS